jgi:hypothetical protein
MKRSIVLATLLGATSVARADLVDIKFGGSISSDIRFRLNGSEVVPADQLAPYPSQYRLLKNGFSRNENVIKTQLTLGVASKVKAVADVEFYWYGYSDLRDINMTTLRESNDPYRIDSYAAYVDVYNVLPHLDLRIGRQVVTWGVADKFSPTNNLNSLDLSDPLLFGRALANQMVRLDWNPWRDLVLTAVWVPIFRPAQLPRTAPLAVNDPDRPPPVQEAAIRDSLGLLQQANPPTQVNVYAMQPDPSIQNSQFGLRLGGRLLNQDVSVSYYHGRFGIPSPAFTVNKPGGVVDVSVMWPRMDVVGADIAGSIEKLRGLGYWAEAAVFFPQEVTYGLYNGSFGGFDALTFNQSPTDPNAYSLQIGGTEGKRPTVVPSTPFVKSTIGFDLTINKYLYTNVQWVHGFIDEFGAGRAIRPGVRVGAPPRTESGLGDYLVLGLDLKLLQEVLLIRVFGAFRIPHVDDQDPKFTAVLFPQLSWAVWDGTEISLGSFVFLGDRSTKFGDPAAGATEVFLKAKFTY